MLKILFKYKYKLKLGNISIRTMSTLPSAKERLLSFRKELKLNNIDCFIQGTNDSHQSEYVCDRDKRLKYLSCFTGSAGTVVVTEKEALLWTDGRYFLAANDEISSEWKLMKQGLPQTPTVEKWISQNININGKIGIDPFLTSISSYNKLKDSLNDTKQEIVLLDKNPIDTIWDKNQPLMPQNKIFIHDIKYSGQSMQDKIKNIQDKIKENNVYGLIVTALDHIAWVLNLRGSDIIYNPVFFSYLIITRDDTFLYIDPSKLENDEEKESDDIKQYLKDIKIRAYCDFLTDLKSMVNKSKENKFWYDPRKTNTAIFNAIPLSQRYESDDCIEIMKSIKNEIEIEGFAACHIRDGAAKSRFFAWINKLREDANDENGKNEIEKHTEWTFAEKLLEFRRENDLFVDLSFETISSIGSNGAIIHYSPTSGKNKQIEVNKIYLLDSGGQYFDGTTDTTRTIWLGINNQKPSNYECECYTRVLKGVINLTKMIFPYNTKGPMIDSMARSYLWQIGLDYRHGTGHGVGSFLNVHEGPQGFTSSTFKRTLYQYGLRTNMIITNEPGYYQSDQFGIRIENVMVVINAKTKYQFDNQQFCTFKTLTMVPIDKQLLDLNIMTKQEIEWLNDYHKTVYQNILPFMKTEYEKNWLKLATDPL